MIRESGNGNKRGTFGTNISFDIDDAPSPKEGSRNQLRALDGLLVGFVSGAKSLVSKPVRARIVQNLRNEVLK